MSPRVSHGLQTRLEPRLTESRVLRLILAPSMSEPETKVGNIVQLIDKDMKATNGKSNGWNFIDALSNASHLFKEEKENNLVYVHPSLRKPENRLNAWSLEMCTESLGTETGSNIMEGNETAFPCSLTKTYPKNINRGMSGSLKNKSSPRHSFPPPLTSISGSSGLIRVRPHREEGRLVLRAVSTPPSSPFFQAERANGRLTMRLLKNEHDDEGNSTEAESKSNWLVCDEDICEDFEDKDETSDIADSVLARTYLVKE